MSYLSHRECTSWINGARSGRTWQPGTGSSWWWLQVLNNAKGMDKVKCLWIKLSLYHFTIKKLRVSPFNAKTYTTCKFLDNCEHERQRWKYFFFDIFNLFQNSYLMVNISTEQKIKSSSKQLKHLKWLFDSNFERKAVLNKTFFSHSPVVWEHLTCLFWLYVFFVSNVLLNLKLML